MLVTGYGNVSFTERDGSWTLPNFLVFILNAFFFPFSQYRSPEEYSERDLNEKLDVYSFGNNIYGLLTGLWVFYENEDDELVQKMVVNGTQAFIDERYRTRSYIEGRLVELMEKCWTYDPKKRISIFEAVAFLKETVKEHERREHRKQGQQQRGTQ